MPDAGKDVSEGVARGLHLDALALEGRNGDVDVTRIGRHALDRPRFAPEFAADDARARAVVLSDLGNGAGGNVLVARVGHFELRGQVGPQLEAVHAAVLVALGHLLVQNAAAGGHPLHVACGHAALVAERVAVGDLTGQHIGDGLDAAMRVPGEAGQIIRGILVAKIVEQQERIELAGLAEAEGALQLDAGALDGGFGFVESL